MDGWCVVFILLQFEWQMMKTLKGNTKSFWWSLLIQTWWRGLVQWLQWLLASSYFLWLTFKVVTPITKVSFWMIYLIKNKKTNKKTTGSGWCCLMLSSSTFWGLPFGATLMWPFKELHFLMLLTWLHFSASEVVTCPHVSSKILRPKGKNKSLLSDITMTLRFHDDLQKLHNQFMLAQCFPSVRFLGSYWPRSSDRFLLMLVGIKSKISFCPPSLLKPSINNRC